MKAQLMVLEDKVEAYVTMARDTEADLGRLDEMEREIEGLLERAGAAANRALGNGTAVAETRARNNVLALDKLKTDYRRAKGNVQTRRDREALFRGARDGRSGGDVVLNMDELMRERGHIEGSDRLADAMLAQAGATEEALMRQQSMTRKNADRLGGLRNTYNLAGGILGKIKCKQQRNNVIVGCVVGFCLCFIIWYKFL